MTPPKPTYEMSRIGRILDSIAGAVLLVVGDWTGWGE